MAVERKPHRQRITHARMLAHRFQGERAQRVAQSRKLLEDRSGKVRSGAEAVPLRKSYRDELVEEDPSSPKESALARPKKKRSGPGMIDQILIITGFALAAVCLSSWIGGQAMGKAADISAQVEAEGGSSSSTAEDAVAEPPAAQSDPVDIPAATPAPADLSWVWPVLGIAGGGAGVVLLSTMSFGAIKRSRRASLEYSEALAAKAEDRRQALAVWEKYTDIHEVLRNRVIEVETDWDLIFKYPTLTDSSVPQTRDFHRAMATLSRASAEPPAELNLSMAIGELHYPQLVTAAEDAWEAAWSFAQRTGTKLIPREERKKLDQILQLLKLARDGGGSEHERSVAYERATKLIGELHFVRVPEAARQAITAEARPMLEAGKLDGVQGAQLEGEPVKLFAL